MVGPHLLIYEKSPRWGPELKRSFLGSPVAPRVVRSLAEIGRLVSANPGSLLVMDMRAGAGECLRFVAQSRQSGLPIRTMLVGSTQTRELEWVARELGADHFVDEEIGGGGLTRLCRLYLEQLNTQDWEMNRQRSAAVIVP